MTARLVFRLTALLTTSERERDRLERQLLKREALLRAILRDDGVYHVLDSAHRLAIKTQLGIDR